MGDRPHQLVYPKENYRGGIRPRREHGYRLYIDLDRNGVVKPIVSCLVGFYFFRPL